MKTIESVTFKLKSGVASEDFLAANQQINEWVKAQPGFESRHLARSKEDVWLDSALWHTQADAERASQQFMNELCDSKFMQMIDEASVNMSQSTVLVSLQG